MNHRPHLQDVPTYPLIDEEGNNIMYTQYYNNIVTDNYENEQ